MKPRRELSSSPLCSCRRCFCRASWRGVAGCCAFCACPCACAAPPTSAPPLPRARRARAPEARRGQLGRPPLTNAPRPWGGGSYLHRGGPHRRSEASRPEPSPPSATPPPQSLTPATAPPGRAAQHRAASPSITVARGPGRARARARAVSDSAQPRRRAQARERAGRGQHRQGAWSSRSWPRPDTAAAWVARCTYLLLASLARPGCEPPGGPHSRGPLSSTRLQPLRLRGDQIIPFFSQCPPAGSLFFFSSPSTLEFWTVAVKRSCTPICPPLICAPGRADQPGTIPRVDFDMTHRCPLADLPQGQTLKPFLVPPHLLVSTPPK